MGDQRPNPDQLLKRVQSEEKSSAQGRLKLFFGASPGVGKTYAMLEAARQRKKEGWDVAVGLVETHGRTETEALLQGLEILPRKEVSYNGVTLPEFDLDAALARRPRLLIIDELAHTNAPGLRHAKRWQDVEEALDAGIDVYTTLNVQHWESLNDVVAQVTGVNVRETVPDTFLQRAHELELVDLAPEDLLQRLADGKVYQGEVAGRAAENFFKPGNLIALRELALRHAAERVDAQMRAYKERHAIEEVWPIGERILVGVTASPMSTRLIRAASRLATRLHAAWIAVHVETPEIKLSAEQRALIIENLRLAEQLGAETVTLTGEDVTDEMISLARNRNVSRIVLGKPARPRWRDWIWGSVVSEMARKCGNIDLHVISGAGPESRPKRFAEERLPVKWRGLAWGAANVAFCTLLCWPLAPFLDRVNLMMIYLLGVVATAYRFNRKTSFIAAVLSVFCFDFFFVPPYFQLAVADAQYFLTFGIMLTVALLISTVMDRLRRQTTALRKRESRMSTLYKLSRELSETPDTRAMLAAAERRLEEFYHRPILLLTEGKQGHLDVAAGDPEVFGWNDNERSVARWVFDKSQPAGAGSDTLSGAAGLYLPLKGIRGTVGVLGIRPDDPQFFADPEQFQLLETFAGEIGGALESTRMSEAIGRSEVQTEMQALGRTGLDRAAASLGEILTPERVRVLSKGLTKEQIIRDLLARLDVPNPNQAFQAVMEREKAGPTLLDTGVMIPHARLRGLREIQACLGISPDAPHLWVLFIGPHDNPQIHLSFLSRISAFFSKAIRVETISTLRSGADALDYIRKEE